MGTDPIFLIQELNQYYGGSHILRNLSFEVPAGKVTTLLGRNGVGKTTLLKALMGLVPLRTGQVLFEGRDVTRAKPYERARAGVGYVPQGREIFARLTVEENLLMGATEIPARVFELFPVLKAMLGRRGGDPSGRAVLRLRALARRPVSRHGARRDRCPRRGHRHGARRGEGYTLWMSADPSARLLRLYTGAVADILDDLGYRQQ